MYLLQKSLLKIVPVILWVQFGCCDLNAPALNPGILTPSKSIGDCHACKLFVDSFIIGLERTARGKYEGGDTAWEEEKLKKSYKRSEMRLIDIQEGLCKEERKYSVQCHHIAEKAEDYIEEWWSHDPDSAEDLFEYICIEKLSLCCPPHHFGKDCSPCVGDHNNLCSGHGKCRGDGTRKGNGTCLCDKGYVGDNCDSCASGYYIKTEDGSLMCVACHPSCVDCRADTNKDCIACKPGFNFDADEGCLDINECDDLNICKRNEYCLNSLGSYACMGCDKSCESCYGDGPDLCRKCAKGYSKKGDICIADREGEDAMDYLSNARYMTYMGLIVATGILIPNSTTLGSLVGVMVLSYIVGAEYYCMINGHTGLVDLKQFDLSRLLFV